jgi:glycosyltransferase involved in cell wall biosynthesis
MYNGEKYIKECIDSIINQDYENLEIILVDDGSPDNCGKIADDYALKDSRIKVIHQKNAGVSVARNNALDMSTGEYVCILDQDDVISKDYVSYFYNLCKNYNAEIALTPTVDKFFDKIKEDTRKDSVKVLIGEEVAIEMLYHKIVIAPWNKMISRKLIVNNNVKFNTNFFNGEGFAFSVQSYQYAEKIAVGQRKVYHYRVGDPQSGASVFKEKYVNSAINAQQYIKETFVKETPELLKAWKFSNWHTHCDCLNIMVGCGATKSNRELYNKLKVVCKGQALCALKAPISLQQKSRGILFKICPYMAAKIINHFRIRKFDDNSK